MTTCDWPAAFTNRTADMFIWTILIVFNSHCMSCLCYSTNMITEIYEYAVVWMACISTGRRNSRYDFNIELTHLDWQI
jgi:hypothetical protein